MTRTNWKTSCALACLALTGAFAFAKGDTRVVDAVRKSDITTLRALVQQHVDVNAPTGDGSTALHWAAHLENIEAIDLLLKAGADVNAANDLGVTPLEAASINRSAALVEKLLNAGANPKAALPSGETVLMSAARAGNTEVVRLLLQHGADPNASEKERGQNALMWAVSEHHPDVVAALLKGGADLHVRSTSYVRPVLVGMPRGAKPYPANGRSASEEETGVIKAPQGGSTPLLLAARVGDVACAKLLIAAGADVNDSLPDHTSVLVLAAHSGHEEFAKFMLEHGADPNAAGSGYTALHAAVLRSEADLLKALLAHGANPNAPLTQGTAVRYVSVDYVLPVNLIDATPVWLAAKYRETELAKALVAAGGDPRLTLNDGTNPIMAAIESPIQLLGLYYQDVRGRYLNPTEMANISLEDEERATLDTVKFFVEQGNDVRAQNAKGDTALHLATARGYNTIVQFLVDKGASLEITNKAGKTPLEMLTQPLLPPHPATADLLHKLGATH